MPAGSRSEGKSKSMIHGLAAPRRDCAEAANSKEEKRLWFWWASRKAGIRARSHGSHSGLQGGDPAGFPEEARFARGHHLHRRTQELLGSRGGRLSARSPHSALARRLTEGDQIGRATGRPSDRQPPAMADRNLSRRQQRSTPGVPRRVRVPAQSSQATDGSLSDSTWPGHG